MGESRQFLELHGSDLVRVESDGASLILFLNAYIHDWSRDSPESAWIGRGYAQPYRVSLADCSDRVAIDLPLRIADGSLTTGKAVFDNGLDVPAAPLRDASLGLVLEDGSVLLLNASAIEIEPCGEKVFIENLSDALKPRGV